jgi:hypothetical protein
MAVGTAQRPGPDAALPVLASATGFNCWHISWVDRYSERKREYGWQRWRSPAQGAVRGPAESASKVGTTLERWLNERVASEPAAGSEHQRRCLFQFHVYTEAGRRSSKTSSGLRLPEIDLNSFVEESIAHSPQIDPKAIALAAADSTAAVLVTKRSRQPHLLVDNGVLRKNEFVKVLSNLRERLKLKVIGVDAAFLFLSKLEGVVDPERKRKIIGTTFIEVFDVEAQKVGAV